MLRTCKNKFKYFDCLVGRRNINKVCNQTTLITIRSNHNQSYKELARSKASFQDLLTCYRNSKSIGKQDDLIQTIETCLLITNKCKLSKQQKEFEECLQDLTNFLNCMTETDTEKINGRSWNFIIQHLLSHSKFENQGRLWYERIVKERKLMIPNNFTLNAVLKYCSNNGDVATCEKLVDTLIERGECTVYSFIYLLSSMLQAGRLNETIETISKMQEFGIEPNYGVFIPLLKEATRSKNTGVGMKLYEIINKTNLESMPLSTALISFFVKSGKQSLAIEECQKLKGKGKMDAITWTCYIQVLIEINSIQEAINCLKEMNESGVKPDYGIFIVLLKACANSGLLEEGKKLHSQALELFDSFNTELHNVIVTFYTKCGHFEKAVEEFRKLQKRGGADVVSWTCLIQVYTASKQLDKAIHTLSEMKSNSVLPNHRTFAILIAACGKQLAFSMGEHIIKLLDSRNKDLVNCIMNFYTKCGHPDKAIEEFRNSQQENLTDEISWIFLIQAYISKKNYEYALSILHEMEKNNTNASSTTYLLLLSAFSENGMYQLGLDLISRVPENFYNSKFSNALMTFYTNCGKAEKAIAEFKKLQMSGGLDVISWNCLIQAHIANGNISQAIKTREIMKEYNQIPNGITFTILLAACYNNGLIEEGVKLHSQAVELLDSFTTDLHNTIMTFYIKCGKTEKAIEEFKKLQMGRGADLISWNCLIQAYIVDRNISQALDTLRIMKENNQEPNEVTFTILLKGCADNNLFKEGEEIHRQVLENNNNHSIELATSIMSFYAKCGNYEKAIDEFEKHRHMADVSLWNTLIQTYIADGDISQATNTLNDMLENNHTPDGVTFTILLKGCAEHACYREGIEIYQQMSRYIANPSPELATSVMNFYTKCGHPRNAIDFYNEYTKIQFRNVSTDTALIQALVEMDDIHQAFVIFNNMIEQNIQPDIVACIVLLQASAKFVSPSKGNQVMKYIQESGLDKSEVLQSSIALYYSKIGEMELSSQIFEKLLSNQANLSIETCNNILSIYAHHGMGFEAFNFYLDIKSNGLQPTEKTCTILLNALSHCGMIEQAEEVYFSIKNPSIYNKCAMVDALARKGRFQQAEQLIIDSNSYILWNTLMSGCRKFNNLDLGERVYKILLSINDMDPSAYILLSQIYMFYNMTDKVNDIRELMISKGIEVKPDIAYNEENGITYKFISGSNNFDRFHQVDRMKDEIFNKIIKAGYVPDSSWVISTNFKTEEERVKSLWRHAEKTAIAHAFVLNRSRKKILLTQNLRVCNDCHSATKFISKVMNCEIIIRDSKRIHHFKDGTCSCNDYW